MGTCSSSASDRYAADKADATDAEGAVDGALVEAGGGTPARWLDAPQTPARRGYYRNLFSTCETTKMATEVAERVKPYIWCVLVVASPRRPTECARWLAY
jgi:hypothetical protein